MGSFPDARESRVEFEHVRKVLGALRSKAVVIDTENNGNLALGGTNTDLLVSSQHASRNHVLDTLEGSVAFQHLSDLGDALSSVGASFPIIETAEHVAGQTAYKNTGFYPSVSGC